MKSIVRLLTYTLLTAGLFSSTGHASTAPATARADAPQITYALAIMGRSSPAGLTDIERDQVREAVANFLRQQDHPMSREYRLRVKFTAAAAGQPAGWVDVKLTFKAAKNYELMAYNTLFGYDAGGYPNFDNARDYYPHP